MISTIKTQREILPVFCIKNLEVIMFMNRGSQVIYLLCDCIGFSMYCNYVHLILYLLVITQGAMNLIQSTVVLFI